MKNITIQLFFQHVKTIRLPVKLALLCTCLSVQAAETNSPTASAECERSASYFSEFYAGLQTMHSHGLKSFVPGSADAQAYFIQVQKNGEKVEMNVLKSLRGDGTLKPQAKENLIKLNQSVAQTMRLLAEHDARENLQRDKVAVKSELMKACPN